MMISMKMAAFLEGSSCNVVDIDRVSKAFIAFIIRVRRPEGKMPTFEN